MRANQRVGFVAGAGHSGSTLLGLVLGAHSKVFYAGEARKSLFLGDESKPLKKRVCKLCGASCPIWGTLRVGPDPRTDPDLYELLSQRAGRPIVIDSTKNVGWIEERSAALIDKGVAVSLVLLVRDGRAVVCSRLRKYPETSMAEHARAWLEQMHASEALAASFAGPVLRLRYEVLATDLEGSLSRLCELLEIEPEPSMRAPFTTDQHPLGGNSGTQFLLARERAASAAVVELNDKTRAFYGQHSGGITLDLRWRKELSAAAREELEALLGEANRAYAWESP